MTGPLDAAGLRELQAPLKQRYRDDPATAVTQLHARATFSDPGVSCTVQGWAGPVRAGLHPATGRDGADACSGDMLFEALLACADVTLRSVATALGVAIQAATLTAGATLDARGTLGISRDVPVGCRDIAITAELDTDADDETLAKLTELTERYCVVGQSLREPVTLTIRRMPTPERRAGTAR
jgi:uncharacterized OsmC-like protein